MKSSRLLSLLLAVCLLFSLSSCSERGNTGQQAPTPAETESSAVDTAAPQEETEPDAPADQQSAGEPESAGQQQPAPADAPYQADDKLVREAVLNFGASSTNGVLQTSVVSLYYHDRWTIDDADGTDFFSWYTGIVSQLYSDEEREELFLAEDGSWAYPAEIYEADVRRYFDATTEQMRDNPDLYHADTNTYYALAGPGVGERPYIKIQSFEQEGELVNIRLYLESETEYRWMMLTIRLTDDGYRYVSYLPQNVSTRSITDRLLEEIILRLGAGISTNPIAPGHYSADWTGLYNYSSWTAQELTPKEFAWWYLGYVTDILTRTEREALFASPLGKNTGYLYPANLYEAAAKAYFDIPAEVLRAGEEYSEEYGGYFSPRPVGRGYTPLITLEDYDQQYDLLTLNVSVSQLEAPDRKMTLTVRLTEDGYQYLSYLPR